MNNNRQLGKASTNTVEAKNVIVKNIITDTIASKLAA